jgi:hypothetical protein
LPISRTFISFLFFSLLITGSGHTLRAQVKIPQGPEVKTSVSTQRILIGEPFQLILQSTFPRANPPARWPSLPDTVPHFELLEAAKTDSASQQDMITVTTTYKLTSFDSGHWVIPRTVVKWGRKTLQSDTIGIDVLTVPLQGNAYRDIHEIVEVPEKPFNWKLWGGIAVTVLLIAFGTWHYLRNRKKPRPMPSAHDSKLSPLDQALQSLRAIREARYMDKGDAQSHFTGMTEAFRVFLLRKFKLPVMSETTGDILLRMQDIKLDRDSISLVAAGLRLADAVKFARYPSSPAEADKSLADMESVIKILNQQNPPV